MNKHKLLEDILGDLSRNPAFFEDLLERSGMTPRNIMQLYMVYKFKWNWSVDEKRDVGWEYSLNRWHDSGLARIFSERYDEEVTIQGMYQRMLNEVKKNEIVGTHH